jgi:hypothetical protein
MNQTEYLQSLILKYPTLPDDLTRCFKEDVRLVELVKPYVYTISLDKLKLFYLKTQYNDLVFLNYISYSQILKKLSLKVQVQGKVISNYLNLAESLALCRLSAQLDLECYTFYVSEYCKLREMNVWPLVKSHLASLA